ncbi:MAG: Gfo/Idh/MocA family oxidoreductase [Chloroflexota bacterium]
MTQAENNKIRIGIVGAGGNTKLMHIPKLQEIEGVEIVSVCNRSRESSEKVASEFGIPTVYDNWWDLIAADDTDAVVIGTWPYMHCRMTLAALAANKHVMCEARMAMNVTEAVTMRNAARENPHLVTQIVPGPMTFGVDQTIQRMIAEEYIGDLLAIELRVNGNRFLDAEAPLQWRHDIDRSGVNIMLLGIWYESLRRWVGDAKSLMAMGKTFVPMRMNPETGNMQAVHIPEHINIIADMACGAQASISMSSVGGFSGPSEIYLYGSEGTLRLVGDKLYGGQVGDEGLHEIEIRSEEVGGWRVEEEFIGAIRGEEVIEYTNFEEGIKYMVFTEAVHESMASGCAVNLEALARSRGA